MIAFTWFDEESGVDKEKLKSGCKVKITGGEWEGQTGKVVGSPSEWAGNKWKAPVRLTKPGLGVWGSIVPIEIDFLEPV